uniref:Uncharacterized protein n=1 Tax=Anguilla anguilla TaxID=7936 RepID=A0A0E9TL76_ANGAN
MLSFISALLILILGCVVYQGNVYFIL